MREYYHVKIKMILILLKKNKRMVNEILKEEMNEIHALTQKCLIPEQWEKMIVENPDLLNQKQHSNDPNAKCISHQH